MSEKLGGHMDRDDELEQIVNDTRKMELEAMGREVKATATPNALKQISEVPDSQFVPGDRMFAIRDEEKGVEALAPRVREVAKLALQVYDNLHHLRREEAQKGADVIAEQHKDYGKHTLVVGNVEVSAAGPAGRWKVEVKTTQVNNSQDRQLVASTLFFDLNSDNLDEMYPARANHWVFGKREGSLSLIGNYQQLHEESNGNLSSSLVAQGWENIGEIWAAEVDTHRGTVNVSAT
jgi:hypothetical protein